jgi:hypothetical protein
MDANLPYQQNLSKHRIAVVALRAASNRLADTRPLMAKLLVTLRSIRPGTLTVVS